MIETSLARPLLSLLSVRLGNSWNGASYPLFFRLRTLMTGPGTVVQAYENAPVTTKHLFNQLWLVQLTSSGYYSFRNLRGGTYMELLGGDYHILNFI